MPREAIGALRNLGATLAVGFILFVYSERIFWAVWRPCSELSGGDSLFDFVITWLAYSAVTYLFLSVAVWARVSNLPSLFLAGALYGWLVEGGVTHTLYGTQSSAPFPMSISTTGLWWHALLSVVVGWGLTHRALLAPTPRPLAGLAVGVGVFWGVWALVWAGETPPLAPSPLAFFANAALLTLGMVVAWRVYSRAGAFHPGAIGVLLSTLVVGAFYLEHVKTLGVRPLIVLPLLLALVLVTLYRHRCLVRPSPKADSSKPESPEPEAPVPWRRLAVLAATPLAATFTYSLARALDLQQLPVAQTLYANGGPIGFVLLTGSVLGCTWRWRSERPEIEST